MIVTCLPSQVFAAAWPASGASSRPQAQSSAARNSCDRGACKCHGCLHRPEAGTFSPDQISVQRRRAIPESRVRYARRAMRGGIYVLNFYSAVFVDQLKRGRKTATIRLGDKSNKYERGQVVWVTVGFRHSPREKIFTAVIDDVEVKQLDELSRRDIEHDNPEFRRLEDERQVPRTDLQPADHRRRRGHRDPLLADRRAARAAPRQRRDAAPQLAGAPMAEYAFLTTWLLESPREPVWEAIHDQERWPSWWRGVEEAEELAGRATATASAPSRGWSGRACCPTGSSSR